MNRLMARMNREEGGAALVICLAFLGFVGVVAVALLNYTSTNLKATVKLRELRSEQYAADGFADLAIDTVRVTRSERTVTPCLSTTQIPLNGETQMKVFCSGTANDVNFTVCETASPTVCAPSEVRLVAGVHYDTPASNSPTTITSWSVRK